MRTDRETKLTDETIIDNVIGKTIINTRINFYEKYMKFMKNHKNYCLYHVCTYY